jgi:sec-independent protein translocase protein TatC
MKDADHRDYGEGMTFWEHLDELRGVIFRSLGFILFFTILAFSFKGILFDTIILGPKNADFITYRVLCKIGQILSLDFFCLDPVSINLININLAGQFMSHMTISIMAGVILSSPFIIWQFWRFIKPGLTEKEKQSTHGAVSIISGLFILGVLFSYFIAVPLMINFLGNYHVSESVSNQIALTSYISAVTSICFLMGLIFEFPVIVLFLTKIGLLTPQFLSQYRKHTIVAILIIAGLITPSPDIFSQLVVSLPLYILYEISLQLSRRTYRKHWSEQEEIKNKQVAG